MLDVQARRWYSLQGAPGMAVTMPSSSYKRVKGRSHTGETRVSMPSSSSWTGEDAFITEAALYTTCFLRLAHALYCHSG